MSRNGFLIAIEGLEHSGMQRIGERLSGKLRHKGYKSSFGAEPVVSPFQNYFREATRENTLALVDSAVSILGFADLSGSVDSVNLYQRICWIIDDFNLGKKLSATDLQVLSLFERKFNLRTVVKDMVSCGGFLVLKGYELGSLAAGLSTGISFEELFCLQKEVLEDDYIRPDVTILIDTPLREYQNYLSRNGLAELTLDESQKVALGYEIAASGLQRGFNYGFVLRVGGGKTEGLVFADILRKLSRFIPALA